MSKKEPIVARISIRFTEAEWKKFLASLTAQERGQFLKHAVYAVSDATIRQGHSFAPVACDLLYETPQEMAERLGQGVEMEWEDTPSSVGAEATAQPGARTAAPVQPFRAGARRGLVRFGRASPNTASTPCPRKPGNAGRR